MCLSFTHINVEVLPSMMFSHYACFFVDFSSVPTLITFRNDIFLVVFIIFVALSCFLVLVIESDLFALA